MQPTLKIRMIILFAAIFAMSVGSTISVIWFNAVHQRNVTVLALANRQQTLIRQMTREVAELEFDRDDQDQHIQALKEAANIFEETLRGLSNGGPVPYATNQVVTIPAIHDPDTQWHLHQVYHTWDIFRGHLNEIMAGNPNNPAYGANIQAVTLLAPKLTQELGQVIQLCQVTLDQEVSLFWWESILFVSVALLTGGGFLFTYNAILNPLHRLEFMVKSMRQGDLNTPVAVTGPREIEAMAHSLDALRLQLKTSQAELNKRLGRLHIEQAQPQPKLTTTFELNQDVAAELSLNQLLAEVTERARTMMRAQVTRLCLVDPNGKDVHLSALNGDRDILPACRLPNKPGLVEQVIGTEQILAAPIACYNCGIAGDRGAYQYVAVPVGNGVNTYGALCAVRSGQEKFNPDEIRALALLADSVGIAIANVHLVEAGRRHAEQAAAMTEREYLAADLHDHLAQTLGLLYLKLDEMKEKLGPDANNEVHTELDGIQLTLNNAYEQVRAILAELRQPRAPTTDPEPGATSGQTLAEELAANVANFRENCGLGAELTIDDPASLILSPMVRRQALYIVGEALTNVSRHAQARRVRVHVSIPARNEICLTVEDDGYGFDPAQVDRSNHFGLTIMRARAEWCGGHLMIDSLPEAGTKVVAYLPLIGLN